MSSTTEEGEDGAQEDAIDFPDEAPEVGETTNGSEWGNQQGSTATGAIDDPEDAPVVDGREEIELEQDQDDESLVNTEGQSACAETLKVIYVATKTISPFPTILPLYRYSQRAQNRTNLLNVTGLRSVLPSQRNSFLP